MKDKSKLRIIPILYFKVDTMKIRQNIKLLPLKLNVSSAFNFCLYTALYFLDFSEMHIYRFYLLSYKE